MSELHAQFTALACDPANNVVVEACAGSGKTWLLTARLFRLLLEGARPDQILAITFTRKAAQEMQARLFDLLRECTLQSDDKLRQLLRERGALDSAENLQRARALAGQVLTSPRGVTIDTFHGWFASLCQMAPLASGFSRQSEPTEQVDFWMDAAIEMFIEQLLNAPVERSQWLGAFDTLALQMDRNAVQQVLRQALANRVACGLWLGNRQAPCLETVFGVTLAQQWPGQVLNNAHCVQQWWAAARALSVGTVKQKNHASAIEQALTGLAATTLDLQTVFHTLKNICLTAKNEPSKNFSKPTAGQLKAGWDETDYVQLFEGLSHQMVLALQREADQLDLQATTALATLIEPLFEVYKTLKTQQGLCDFDDLEAVALSLLMNDEQRAYMQQKLDTRVRHLLVDEFQDTNPVQWNILKFWLQDYSNHDKPSIFLVGDPKQSIYRFRRAEARLFSHVRTWMVDHFFAKTLESDSTRRCSPAVVAVVNRVFQAHAVRGKTVFRQHSSLVESDSSSGLQGLHVYPLVDSKDTCLDEAQLLVRTLQQWILQGDIKNLSEVMVLVRTHKSGVPLMSALRASGLAYAIQDKGERYSSLVWSDTIALLGFLNNPCENLHLLQLLRCPLIALTSAQFQDLIQAGQATQASTVWDTLNHLAGQATQPWLGLVEKLAHWLSMSRALPLFETLSKVIADTRAPEQYLNATGSQQRVMMAEHWDWLKAWALSLNKGRFQSLRQAYDEALKLQAYVHSDGQGAASLPNALRIMTVHSAKGLEANHVWLFDANSGAKFGGSQAGLLIDWALGQSHPNAVTVMSNLSRHSPGRAAAQAIEQQAFADEEDHLLYVALTRARYSIHVSGNQKKGTSQGWYERLRPEATQLHPAWLDPEGVCAKSEALGSEALDSAALSSEPNTPAVWVRTAFPVLQPLARSVGYSVPRVTSPELRMGTAWHAALECIDELASVSFHQWWKTVQVRCEKVFFSLRGNELEQVEQACARLAHQAVLQPWLQGAAASNYRVFNELEWVLGDRLLRADRVLELTDRFLVLDYKWEVSAVNLPAYSRQVLEYVSLVDQTLGQSKKFFPTQAALIDREGQIHWLTSV